MNLPNRRTLLTAGAATALAGITACNKASSGSDSGSSSSTTTTTHPVETTRRIRLRHPDGSGELVRPGQEPRRHARTPRRRHLRRRPASSTTPASTT